MIYEIYVTHNKDAKKHFRTTNRLIDEGRKKEKVLIHSIKGKSRAATFILAY